MAVADYYLCDLCSRKTFYDAELQYDGTETPLSIERPLLVGAGAMAVLCTKCAATHDVVIQKMQQKESTEEPTS